MPSQHDGPQRTPSIHTESFGITLADVNFTDVQIGSFRMLSRLGAGGSAPVWLGQDRNISKHVVACKIFGAESEDRERIDAMYSQIQRDTEPLVQFEGRENILRFKELVPPIDGCIDSSQNFVPLMDANLSLGGQRRVTIIAMATEYINAGSLANRSYRNYAPGSSGKYLSELADLVQALMFVHDKGRVHCDIKPSNIFWRRGTDDGYESSCLVLGDWGISHNLQQVKFVSTFLGSLPYLAPEAFDGAIPVPERDVYALGCTLFELIYGEPPFKPETSELKFLTEVSRERAIAKLYSELHKFAPRPHAYGRGSLPISLELDKTINEMMSVEPEKRPKLQKVIDVLRQERENRRKRIDTLASRKRVTLPCPPVWLGRGKISPSFRMQCRGERPVFMFLMLPERTNELVQDLFDILEHFFPSAFSCLETFGKYEFVVRIWDTEDFGQTADCCASLVKNVLKDQEHLRLFISNRVYSTDTPLKNPLSPEMQREVAIHLYSLQNAGTAGGHLEVDALETKNSLAELRQIGVIQGQMERNPFEGVRIPCVCLVHGGFDSNRSKEIHAKSILQAMTERSSSSPPGSSIPSSVRRSVQLYQNSGHTIEGFEIERAEFALEFTAQTFAGIRDVPSNVFAEVTVPGVQTWTLISTKYLGVISEQVLLS